MSKIQTISFDFYGTLVQWHQALDATARAILKRKGADAIDLDSLLGSFHQVCRALRDTPPFRSYRNILRMGLAAALAQHDLDHDLEDHAILMRCVSTIAPFPEVPEALRQLQSRFKIGLISNTDDDIIAGSLASLGIAPDFVTTAQQAGAYKPDRQLFTAALRKMGVTPSEVLHVAASQELDLQVCHATGIPAIWINRRDEVPDKRWKRLATHPDLVVLPESVIKFAGQLPE